jgi:hypothetical protein
MTKLILGAVAVVVAMLAVAAPATAAPFTPRLNVALQVAYDYWGGIPANCTSINRQIVPDGSLARFNEGEATSGVATLATHPQPCHLWVERRLASPVIFATTCAIMVHEVGHLHGYDHADDPADVMNPEGASVGQCQRLDRLAFVMRANGRFSENRRAWAARLFWAPLLQAQE